MFTGHIGNWEVLPLATARKGVQFATVYRPADNPLIDEIILELRRASDGANEKLFPKGAQGARQMLAHLREGGYVGMLPDQKMNDGIQVRFFGRPAMTASALAALALKLRCPVLPTYAQRIAPARFRVTYEPPVPLPDTGDRATDVAALTQAVNDRLEAWIRAKPESWLWLHRRWPKEAYDGL
jgi:KDO2-lipid IV(A) lauroyltransferase